MELKMLNGASPQMILQGVEAGYNKKATRI